MNNVVELSVTATPQTALKKLAKAEIPVYKVKKSGAKLYFGVNEEYVEKVFAIFAHACYNISISSKSRKNLIITSLKRRIGLLIGAAAFVALTLICGNVLFRIKVTGNGSYLKDEVLSLAAECGAREWSFSKKLDKPLLQAKIMALPNVNFCSVQRQGSYLIIDVHTDAEQSLATDYKPLVSDCEGEVYNIVAICGTAQKCAGERVSAGEVLIGAYSLSEEGERRKCLAVGYAEIKINATLTLFFDGESEQNRDSALSSTALYSERVIEKSCSVRRSGEGVVYTVNFTYLKTLSVNMQ